jgi:alkylation response protein AidB-like acyl-CoA dehydrogenase
VNFSHSDEQRMVKDLVDRFARDRCSLVERPARRTPPAGFDQENWATLAQLGLLGLPFPAACGGLDGGPVESIVIMEAIGHGLVAEPLLPELFFAGRVLARSYAENAAGRIAQIISGSGHFAVAWAERGRLSRIDPADTRAQVVGGVVRLDGAKTFVMAGAATGAFLVTALEAGEPNLFLVLPNADGLDATPYQLVDGSWAMELRFTSVEAERVARGWPAFCAALDDARLAGCAEMVGVMELLFETTLEHLRQRKQFGATLGSFQALQHRMADLYATLELSRSLLYRAALAETREVAREIAAARAYIAGAAVTLAEEGVQFHGAIGITDELIVGHGLKRILVLANMFGDGDQDLERYLDLSA